MRSDRAGSIHDYILEETPVGTVVAMFNTDEEFGVRPPDDAPPPSPHVLLPRLSTQGQLETGR